VIRVRPEWLDVEEQQLVARQRARVEIPTRQRDFAELWQEAPRQQEKRKVG
jgi:hypothetical protein